MTTIRPKDPQKGAGSLRDRIGRLRILRRRRAPALPRQGSLRWSFNWAFEGIVYVLRTQRNMQLHVAAGALALVMGLTLNLTRLESRPTRGPLGDYYFLIDIEGHLADALLADALRGIKYRHRSVKFLGSYPRARREGIFQEMEEEAAWAAAGEWVDDLGRLLDGGPDEPAK